MLSAHSNRALYCQVLDCPAARIVRNSEIINNEFADNWEGVVFQVSITVMKKTLKLQKININMKFYILQGNEKLDFSHLIYGTT